MLNEDLVHPPVVDSVVEMNDPTSESDHRGKLPRAFDR